MINSCNKSGSGSNSETKLWKPCCAETTNFGDLMCRNHGYKYSIHRHASVSSGPKSPPYLFGVPHSGYSPARYTARPFRHPQVTSTSLGTYFGPHDDY